MTDVTIPALGGLIIGGMASVIAVMVLWWRGPLLAVCFFGQTSTGTVVGMERGRAFRPKWRISFPGPDGQEVEFEEPIALKVKVGEVLPVHYRRNNTAIATGGRIRHFFGEIVVFGIVFGIFGPIALVGSVCVLAGAGKDVFYGVVASGSFVVIATILLFVAGMSYSRVRSWHRRVVADGVVTRVQPRKLGAKEYPHPWVAYETQGGDRIEYWDIALNGYTPGEQVAVYYDPEYPEFTSTGIDKSGNVWQVAFFGVAGLLFLAAGVWSGWTHLISG